ncbi:hypothetical protein H6P81_019359 [Aristolochia fimbriata]|uniref:F-box domain-containing protein n=1 Tax=Aristolochia fimbriata TaxID=158543 RepID=A0AAV7DT82_ARIFI|nr:hypothetical protein H6P81_019359 [Aristolochia fimbriata]
MEEERVVDFSDLPENCISHALSFTTPLDASRAAVVSSVFRTASESDSLWQKFLPPDYMEIISTSASPMEFSSNKDLYLRLCDSILVDGGKMGFSLQKSSGKKCYTLSPRELQIIWVDAPRCWRWIPTRTSRFGEAVELLGVSWLEIHGKINARILSPKTDYVACLLLKTVDGATGLDYPPAELFVKAGGRAHKKNGYLYVDGDRLPVLNPEILTALRIKMEARRPIDIPRVPHSRDDGWMEIELGRFFNDGEGGDVEMSIMEIKGRNLKKGLIIEGIEIRPYNRF